MLTPKNNSLTWWVKAVSRVMSGVDFVWWTLWIFLCFLAAFFRSIEKANTMSKRIQERTEEELGGSKVGVSVFDFNKPEPRAILLLRSGCFQYPGESAAGFGVCPRSRGKVEVGQCPKQSKNKKCVLECWKETTSLRGVAGNCNETMPKAASLKVQGVARNCSERLRSNYRRPGWTTTTCTSQIMGMLRNSSLIFVESWIEWRMMRCLTWTPTYHAPGNYFERFWWFLELISRFEIDFRRCGKYFSDDSNFWCVWGWTTCNELCACAVACLHPHNSISNVVSLMIHDNIYI